MSSQRAPKLSLMVESWGQPAQNTQGKAVFPPLGLPSTCPRFHEAPAGIPGVGVDITPLKIPVFALKLCEAPHPFHAQYT